MSEQRESEYRRLRWVNAVEFASFLLVACALLGIFGHVITRYMVGQFGEDLGSILALPFIMAGSFLIARGGRALTRYHDRLLKSIKKAKY